MSLTEWVDLARSLGERKFVARHAGYFLLTTEDAVELTTMLQTRVTDGPNARRRLAGRNIEIRPVEHAATSPAGSPVTIGRSRTCDIVFRHPSVSKVHAHLVLLGKKLAVIDLSSRNGTTVNGRAIPPDRPERVDRQDRVQFGSVQTMVLDPSDLYDLLSKMP
jgi:hypothetical protein